MLLLIAEIILFILLFVFFCCGERALDEQRKEIEWEKEKIISKCMECINTYNELIEMLKKYVQDESPPNGIEKF